MRQLNSSKLNFKVGATLLNCNFNLSIIIENIAAYADSKGCLRPHEKKYFAKHSNSAKALPVLAYVIDRLLIRFSIGDESPIPTKYGDIVKVAEGYSKMALIFKCSFSSEKEPERFVLKFDKNFDNGVVSRCQTYSELRDLSTSGKCDAQTAEQAKAYDRLRDTEIGQYILPMFRYYKRYNAIIEPCVDYVGSLEDCANWLLDDQRTAFSAAWCDVINAKEAIARLASDNGLRDVIGNSGNCGVKDGHIYIIDYAL